MKSSLAEIYQKDQKCGQQKNNKMKFKYLKLTRSEQRDKGSLITSKGISILV